MRLLKLAISLVVYMYDGIGDRVKRLIGIPTKPRAVVLYYHGISTAERESFARQMRILRNVARPTSCWEDKLDGAARYAAVSFDDAFVSVFENALPVLRDQKVPATIFVPSGYLGAAPGWIKNGSPLGRGDTVMTGEQIRQLASEPLVTIGSHTITHPHITQLPDSAAARELSESKVALEDITGKEVSLFSFPYGAWTGRDIELARTAGYRRVFGIQPSLAFRASNEFFVGRVAASPSDWPIEFRLKLAGAYRWKAWFKS